MTASAPNILEAINISKCFGELQALDNVSLKLQRGSFHTLLGDRQIHSMALREKHGQDRR